MKVIARRDPILNEVEVFILDDRFSGKHILAVDNVNENGYIMFRSDELQDSDSVRPAFKMNVDIFEAIVKAGSEIMPPDAGTERHLKDAMTVRDRLLSILERNTGLTSEENLEKLPRAVMG